MVTREKQVLLRQLSESKGVIRKKDASLRQLRSLNRLQLEVSNGVKKENLELGELLFDAKRLQAILADRNDVMMALSKGLELNILELGSARLVQLRIQFHDVDLTLLNYTTTIGSGSVCDVFKYKLPPRKSSSEETERKEVEVALKVFKKGSKVSGETVIEETRRMVSTNHPNIILCYGCHVKTLKGIFMELCDKSLEKMIENQNLPSFKGKVSIVKQVASGMNYLHVEKRIIHRDLKPDNVLLLNDVCKIVDFGISREISELKTSMKLSSGAAGTPFYWAPEMFTKTTGEKYNTSCDVFSFGIICFVLFFGKSSNKDLQDLLYGGYSISTEQDKISEFIHSQGKSWKPKYPVGFDSSKCSKKETNFLGMMKVCCSFDPTERPTFKKILELIEKGME